MNLPNIDYAALERRLAAQQAAAAAVAGAGYTGPRGTKTTLPAVPPAVAARRNTTTPPSPQMFAQVPPGQVAPARYTPPNPQMFAQVPPGQIAPARYNPTSATTAQRERMATLEDLAGYNWGNLGQIGSQAQAMLDAPSASVGPGNMEGMRPIVTAAQSIQNSGESPEKIAANLNTLSGLTMDEIDYFNAAVDSGFFDGVAAGGGMPPAGGMDPMGDMGVGDMGVGNMGVGDVGVGDMGGSFDFGGGGMGDMGGGVGGRVPTPTTGFTDTQKSVINNALQDRMDVITTMVSEGLLDVASAQGVWESERQRIYNDFLTEQANVLSGYQSDQSLRQAQAQQLRNSLFGDVDQSLAAEDFAMANAILQGAGAENQDYLQSINRIGRMSDDALGMMGGTVMRDAQGNPILDEAGRPQFGGGIFGNYAQDLLSQERDMGAGAQFNAIDQLQLADETALQGLQLAEFLGVDPSTFAAGQYAGVDVGSLQAGRDASAAATAEAELDRALRRELSEADITSREGMSAADILSREGMAADKDLLSRDLAADDLALAMQKLAQDSGQFRSQQLEDKLANTQKMNLATEELALDQAQMEADMLFDAAMLAREDGGGGNNPLTNALMTGLAGQLSDVAYQGALSDITEALIMEGETSLDDRSLGKILDTLDPKYQELISTLMAEQMGMSLDDTTAITDAQQAGAIVGEVPVEEVPKAPTSSSGEMNLSESEMMEADIRPEDLVISGEEIDFDNLIEPKSRKQAPMGMYEQNAQGVPLTPMTWKNGRPLYKDSSGDYYYIGYRGQKIRDTRGWFDRSTGGEWGWVPEYKPISESKYDEFGLG